ncbi:MAG: toprim domain-containing protein [Solirubrobacteraceae bacterium]
MIAGCADVDRSALVVCEGVFDAILAGRHFATAAMTGAKLPDAGVADRLVAAAAGRPIVVCFDDDKDGRLGAERLVALIRERSAGGAASITLPANDVNALLRDAPEQFGDTLRALVVAGVQRASANPSKALSHDHERDADLLPARPCRTRAPTARRPGDPARRRRRPLRRTRKSVWPSCGPRPRLAATKLLSRDPSGFDQVSGEEFGRLGGLPIQAALRRGPQGASLVLSVGGIA